MLTMTLIAWQASTETTLTSTNATNIFIPVGQMIFGADYATLKIVINITQIFEETREVCHLSDAIEELINGRTKDISDPNKKVLDVVISSIKDMCEDDKASLAQIKASFGISPNVGLIKRRPKLPIYIAYCIDNQFSHIFFHE